MSVPVGAFASKSRPITAVNWSSDSSTEKSSSPRKLAGKTRRPCRLTTNGFTLLPPGRARSPACCLVLSCGGDPVHDLGHTCCPTRNAPVMFLARSDWRGFSSAPAAPTVLTMIAEDDAAGPLDHEVHVDTGGAPPSATLLARLDKLRLVVTHLYGLTETYGPLAINEWQPEWDDLEPDRQATLRARQGAPNIIARPLRVLDDQGRDVPADGETIGEIAVSGNDVMLGYYRDDEATREVTRGGCFLTGDLAVMHPDGYVEIRDRSKDIIISGGENIASV